MTCLTCLNLEAGKSWQGLFNGVVSPVFYAFGWKITTDTTACADLFVCFDGTEVKGKITATWLLYQPNFFFYQVPWPSYIGQMQSGPNIMGCSGIMVVVNTAAKNNTLSCQFLGA